MSRYSSLNNDQPVVNDKVQHPKLQRTNAYKNAKGMNKSFNIHAAFFVLDRVAATLLHLFRNASRH